MPVYLLSVLTQQCGKWFSTLLRSLPLWECLSAMQEACVRLTSCRPQVDHRPPADCPKWLKERESLEYHFCESLFPYNY